MRRPTPCFIVSLFLLSLVSSHTQPRGQTAPGAAYDAVRDFSAAQIPPGPYLSDPAQSGVKFVQLVSSMRKALVYGSAVCETARAAPAETNSETGWQLDTSDPYDASKGPTRKAASRRLKTPCAARSTPPKSSREAAPRPEPADAPGLNRRISREVFGRADQGPFRGGR